MITDPISDMLTRIRNAYAVSKESVNISDSKLKQAVLSILKDNGYVNSYKEKDGILTIELKYNGEVPAIEKIERISKPGRRMYVGKEDIPTILSGRGIVVISTSKGVFSGSDAKKQKLGGELICKVY